VSHRQQVQGLQQRVAQVVELVLVHAGVHHEEEGGGAAGRRLELVLHRGELGDELSWQISLRNVLAVVRRKMIPCTAHAHNTRDSNRVGACKFRLWIDEWMDDSQSPHLFLSNWNLIEKD
jgi:hypothetical protein